MKKHLHILFLVLFTGITCWSQENDLTAEYNAKKYLREGNKLLESGKTDEATIAYQKSTEANGLSYKANNNLGSAYLASKKYEEAIQQFEIAAKTATEKTDKANIYHNLGVAQEKANQLEKAVDAYKQALKNNPSQEASRYNLANALRKLKKQQQQQQQNQDNKDQNKDQNKKDDQNQKGDDKKDSDKNDKGDKNQDQNKDKGDNKDENNSDKNQENKDKGEEDQKKDGDPKDENQNQDKSGNGDEKKDQPQPSNPQKSKLSKAEIEQLLNAMNDQEKKTQDKVNAQKVKAKVRSNEKDW